MRIQHARVRLAISTDMSQVFGHDASQVGDGLHLRAVQVLSPSTIQYCILNISTNIQKPSQFSTYCTSAYLVRYVTTYVTVT